MACAKATELRRLCQRLARHDERKDLARQHAAIGRGFENNGLDIDTIVACRKHSASGFSDSGR
jgi:hypothetical protein